MEKYTALLIPAYLSGFIFAVLLIPILTLSSGLWDKSTLLWTDPSLAIIFIVGALVGMTGIFLARGIRYLFLEQSS